MKNITSKLILIALGAVVGHTLGDKAIGAIETVKK